MLRGSIITAFILLLFGCKKTETGISPDAFQKVILHYTPGYTGWEDYVVFDIEISSNGHTRLHVAEAYNLTGEPDSSQIGYFEGELADSSLSRLNDYFSQVNIDTLQASPVDSFVITPDDAYYNFILYQHGKRKQIECASSYFPDIAEPVAAYLYFISRKNNLPRTAIPFDLEK